MKFIILSAVIVLSSAYAGEKSFDLPKGELTLKNLRGNTIITASDTKQAKISYVQRKWSDNCELKLKKDGDEVKIKVAQKDAKKKTKCIVNFNVEINKNIELDLKTGKGNIAINGSKSDIEIKTDFGKTSIKKFNGEKLDLKVGSGNIDIQGSFKSSKIKLGKGDLKLKYKKSSYQSKVTIDIGAGDGVIKLPKGIKPDLDFTSGIGSLENQITEKSGQSIKIKYSTGLGGLKVIR